MHIRFQRANLAVEGILLNLLYVCCTFPKAMQPSTLFFFFQTRTLKYHSQAAPPPKYELLVFWQIPRLYIQSIPKSVNSQKQVIFHLTQHFLQMTQHFAVISVNDGTYTTSEKIGPYRFLRSHQLSALFYVLLLHFLSPSGKQNMLITQSSKKSVQLLPITKQNGLLKLKP